MKCNPMSPMYLTILLTILLTISGQVACVIITHFQVFILPNALSECSGHGASMENAMKQNMAHL